MKKIRVGIVNYLNTQPLIYGLERSPFRDKIDLIGDYPAKLVHYLKEDQIDVGLIPIGSLVDFDEWHIVGNYCIGTEGEVASVCLFSEVPVEELTEVYLDYQSRTSVALVQWLMKEHWGISPKLIPAKDESYREKLKGTTGGVVIGDRALEQRNHSTFVYDLGSEWRFVTGLPFVFAAWISKKPLPEDFIKEFDAANAIGLEKIDEIVSKLNFPSFDMKKYYELYLNYELTENKRKGMNLFLEYLKNK